MGWINSEIIPKLGVLQLADVTAAHLDQPYRSLTARRSAPPSIRQVHAMIRQFFNQAMKWGWASSNPALLASPPKVPAAQIVTLSCYLERRPAADTPSKTGYAILDLRTRAERRKFGHPPGSRKVSLLWHSFAPKRDGIYLCQHAVRSKLPASRGATEIAGGFVAWISDGMPIDYSR
ncbi:hypothetical protein [Ferrimicrobium sp.]|uniref:hypothetical protein n=1 Tax=Ferrimicrobium sp. TaxID=2926050 RepID=UPI00262B390A|nr:hypothetical protein [Ferrimicrobium sp.]